ncbi:MAG TPA: tetratricopeptide repeat protein [Candidatus Omnitrophota bacterium]|nr:tetratricopeptide repeat protein [Candidatus Omnitrophota bacterium]
MGKIFLAIGLIFLAPIISFAQKTEDALFEEASVCIMQGDYDKASEKYQEAIAVDPQSVLAHQLLGITYGFQYAMTRNMEFKQKQIETFLKALELDPEYWPAMTHLGMAYYAIGDKANAARYLKRVLEIQPKHPERVLYQKVIAEAEKAASEKPASK